jgi:hypothetical protein
MGRQKLENGKQAVPCSYGEPFQKLSDWDKV